MQVFLEHDRISAQTLWVATHVPSVLLREKRRDRVIMAATWENEGLDLNKVLQNYVLHVLKGRF